MNKLLYILLAISLTSCFRDRIELDLNEDNEKIVITSWITNLDEPQFVTIAKTANYLGFEAQEFVSGANVKLSSDAEEYFLTEVESGKYYLSSDWTAVIGDTYTLDVELDGVEYIASHLMRPCPLLEDVSYLLSGVNDADTENLYGTTFSFQETPGEDDAYFAIDYLKGTMAGDSLRNGVSANDDFADDEYFEDIQISESERLFSIGDTAVLELYSIGDESANYLFDIESEVFRGSPFDPPPANVRTNFTGGALGYFIISGAQQVEVVIE